MFREHQNNWSQAFQASRNHTKDGRDNVGMTCKKWTVWTFFLTFNLTRCFCLHDWHHEHGLHFCFFLSHCGHVFGIKHPKRERETRFSRQVVLKELLLSGLPSKKKNPQAAMLDLSICSQSSSGGPDCVVTSSRKFGANAHGSLISLTLHRSWEHQVPLYWISLFKW